MIKGGNIDFQQQQMQQQQMQQQQMQQQQMQPQPGIIGTALNDIKANQNVLNPMHSDFKECVSICKQISEQKLNFISFNLGLE